MMAMRSLTCRTFAAVLALSMGSVSGQTDSEISDQIRAFKEGGEKGCYATGESLGHPPADVDKFCQCRVRAINEALSEQQWQEFGTSLARGAERSITAVVRRLLMRANEICGTAKS